MKAKASVAAAPWTDKKKAAMEADPENRPYVWLLTDEDGARHLAHGEVTEELAQQAEAALGMARAS